jgi:hypothetical protein
VGVLGSDVTAELAAGEAGGGIAAADSSACRSAATGQAWEELEARYRRDSLDQVHAHLGQEQSEQDHARGMTLSFGQALDLASGTAPPA